MSELQRRIWRIQKRVAEGRLCRFLQEKSGHRVSVQPYFYSGGPHDNTSEMLGCAVVKWPGLPLCVGGCVFTYGLRFYLIGLDVIARGQLVLRRWRLRAGPGSRRHDHSLAVRIRRRRTGRAPSPVS